MHLYVKTDQLGYNEMMTATALAVSQYGPLIELEVPFVKKSPNLESAKAVELIVDELLTYLTAEANTGIITGKSKRQTLEALLTVRPPMPLPDWFLTKMDRLLQWEFIQKTIVDASLLKPVSFSLPKSSHKAADHCALWKGDITTLYADAIVNAANAALLGCFTPFHACIDNVIHAAAGPQLRRDCHSIMQKQGNIEPTGQAKITRGYNLPARFVLHTVGPIFDGRQTRPSDSQIRQLASCYTSCLDLASRISGIRTLAFCAISTGVFGFPKKIAAKTALDTVEHWLLKHPGQLDRIVFNVFSDTDEHIYEEVLLEKTP